MSHISRLRESFDPDFLNTEGPTPNLTSTNRHPLNCGICGRTLYVDDSTHERFLEALRWDPSNTPFYCEECEEDLTNPDFER